MREGEEVRELEVRGGGVSKVKGSTRTSRYIQTKHGRVLLERRLRVCSRDPLEDVLYFLRRYTYTTPITAGEKERTNEVVG